MPFGILDVEVKTLISDVIRVGAVPTTYELAGYVRIMYTCGMSWSQSPLTDLLRPGKIW